MRKLSGLLQFVGRKGDLDTAKEQKRRAGSDLKTFNIYSENSCSIASVAERGQQLEVITDGGPVEVTEPLEYYRAS